MLRFQIRKPRAFTIVELLVVIGIIALLISILLPVLGKAREAGNRAACLSNLHQMGIAIVLYCNENKNRLPKSTSVTHLPVGTTYIPMYEDWIYWQANRNLDDSAIAKPLNASGGVLRKLLRCPTDNLEDRTTPPPYVDPAAGKYKFSYSINWTVQVGEGATCTTRKITDYRHSSEKILFTEELDPNDGRWQPDPTNPLAGDRLTLRHGHAKSKYFGVTVGINVNSAFFDGHAAPITQDYADEDPAFAPGRHWDPDQ